MLESIKKKVGERVRDLRKAAGFRSAESLAEALKMSATSVYELERGSNWISPEMLQGLCAVFNVPASAFFTDQSYVPPKPTLQEALAIIQEAASELESFRSHRKTGDELLAELEDETFGKEEVTRKQKKTHSGNNNSA